MIVVADFLGSQGADLLFQRCCLLGDQRAQALDLFLGSFRAAIVERSGIGALGLCGRKIAHGIAGLVFSSITLTDRIAGAVFSGLQSTLCFARALFGLLELRAQIFQFGIGSTAARGRASTRYRHSSVAAVVRRLHAIERTRDDRGLGDVFAASEIIDKSHVFEGKTEVRLFDF